MRYYVYKDKAGEWRWRAVAQNGKIVADGSEGYASRSNALRAAKRFILSHHGHRFEVEVLQ